MMTNLFSMFDPSIFFLNLSLNWFSAIIPFLFIPLSTWLIPNNYFLFLNLILNNLYKEFKIIINNKNNNNFILIFTCLFFFILLNNFLGLFPYIFTNTSHLIFNLTLALPLWLSLMIYGWLKKTKNMFIHLVPQGTPNILIPFMICIETISNVIRPITLTVRLTANMIAGHLLLVLLGNTGPNMNNLLIPLLLLTQLILLTLESAVSIIQSYVFSILISLYFSEI